MMPEQLWSTTLNPETRTLRKLTIDDAGGSDGGVCLGAWARTDTVLLPWLRWIAAGVS